MRSAYSLFVLALSLLAGSAHAQAYNSYAGYESWQNQQAYHAPRVYPYGPYYGRPYAPRFIGRPMYGYGYAGGSGVNDMYRWRATQALEEQAVQLRNINRAIRDQTFQQQLDAHADRMEAIRRDIGKD